MCKKQSVKLIKKNDCFTGGYVPHCFWAGGSKLSLHGLPGNCLEATKSLVHNLKKMETADLTLLFPVFVLS